MWRLHNSKNGIGFWTVGRRTFGRRTFGRTDVWPTERLAERMFSRTNGWPNGWVFWMRLKTKVQCVYTCRKSCTHYKDPVIHVSVRWVAETRKYPACTYKRSQNDWPASYWKLNVMIYIAPYLTLTSRASSERGECLTWVRLADRQPLRRTRTAFSLGFA